MKTLTCKCFIIVLTDNLVSLHHFLHVLVLIAVLLLLRIIGTPGRLMHVVTEMNLKLHNVEYVVFDEADR